MNIAYQIKAVLLKNIGSALTASIGLAPNRFLAKVASDMKKPDGLTLIRTEDLPHILFQLKLRDLPGIGHNMYHRLVLKGIDSVQQLCTLPTETLKRAWGSLIGTQFFHNLRGDDTEEIPTKERSIGHSHVLSPEKRNPTDAYDVLIRLVHKAAARLRNKKYAAGHMSLSVSTTEHKWWGNHIAIDYRSDTQSLLDTLDYLWQKRPTDAIPKKVGITLFNFEHQNNLTLNLFETETDRFKLAKAMDTLNDKYGKRALYFADMYNAKDAAPMRLAFNYIPNGDW
jgi:DNA polymerase-4